MRDYTIDFLGAVERGNLAKIQDYVSERKIDVEGINKSGAMGCATKEGNIEVVKLLVDLGADIDVKTSFFHSTPLGLASFLGNLEMMKCLIKLGAKVNCGDEKISPLEAALFSGKDRVEVIDLLLNSGTDINQISEMERNAWRGGIVGLALENNNVEVALRLIDKGAAIQNDGRILKVVAKKGYAQLVPLLVEKGLDPNRPCGIRSWPIHTAATFGHTETVLAFLDVGARIDDWTVLFGTPLQIASRKGHSQLAQSLINRGANITSEAFFNAISKCDLQTVEMFLSKEISDKDLCEGLCIAAKEDKIEAMQALMAKGANPNGMNLKCETALNIASREGHSQLAQILINSGANITSEAFFNAISKCDLQTVEMFLSKEISDKDLCEGLCIAAKEDKIEAMQALMAKGANPKGMINLKGKTALNYAFEIGKGEMINQMIGLINNDQHWSSMSQNDLLADGKLTEFLTPRTIDLITSHIDENKLHPSIVDKKYLLDLALSHVKFKHVGQENYYVIAQELFDSPDRDSILNRRGGIVMLAKKIAQEKECIKENFICNGFVEDNEFVKIAQEFSFINEMTEVEKSKLSELVSDIAISSNQELTSLSDLSFFKILPNIVFMPKGGQKLNTEEEQKNTVASQVL